MVEKKQDMAAIVAGWLEKNQQTSKVTKQGTRTEFETTIEMQHGSYRVVLCTRKKDDFFAVYAYSPIKISEAHRADWLDITSKTNWRYEFARMELNPVDGQFRCSSTVVLPESHLTIAMVEKMTLFVVNWLDPVFPTLKTLAEEDPL